MPGNINIASVYDLSTISPSKIGRIINNNVSKASTSYLNYLCA